jgi:hypothetical protein
MQAMSKSRGSARRRREPVQPAAKAAVEALPDAAANADSGLRWITTAGLLVVALATIGLVVYVRVRLASIPLERDEGEYAYAGQLILDGIPPYVLAYNMKFPGTYYAYAALMVFGQTLRVSASA